MPVAPCQQDMHVREMAEDENLRRLANFSGAPWTPQNSYFSSVERFTQASWQNHIWPLIKSANLDRVVDLAAGHGRHTAEFLSRGAQSVFVLDIQPGNVDLCRKRFAGNPKVQCEVTDGFSFRPVPDSWATLLFTFDAMVHFDSDVVRSYLRDCRRVLRHDGLGFFHHSNYTDGSSDWTKAPHARNFMSKELFRHYAEKEGLQITTQRTIKWGDIADFDCLSLIRLP